MDALQFLFQSIIRSDLLALALIVFLFFLPLFFFANWSMKRGFQFALRPIAAYDALKALLAQAAEAGMPVHLSLGIGGIGGQATADTTAGLYVLEYLADRAAVSASPPIVTMAHPTALPVAQDILRRAYRRHGYPEEYDPARVRFIAPDATLGTGQGASPALYSGGTYDGFAYAAGTMRLLTRQPLIANVMVGRYGDEFLLLGETAAQVKLHQIGGTSEVSVLPFVQATVDDPLIGEEIYAAGAYLSNKPAHLGSLFAQDILRWSIVGLVALGVILKSVGMF